MKFTALPGMDAVESDLQQQIAHQYQRLAAGYRPRTRHLGADGTARYHNRLFLESSPYLLQHAHNPVNWYPWGDEAFLAARDTHRPVLLSIGYSTCHWCHVMEEESFEDEDIACYLNQHYISIKVDREERPDIDAIYMSAVQAQTGSGGWPMTVWLTTERKPFYGGTYFPPRDGQRGAQIGFMTMLRKLHDVFTTEYDKVSQASEALTSAVDKALTPRPGKGMPGESVLHTAAQFYKKHFDPEYGGLGGAPKFPGSYPIRFLLRYARRSGDEEVLQHVKYTLHSMAAGGIYDQVGGGFHRYSTDARWLVPHFEKMLYDNALLATTYLEAFQLTHDASFARVTHGILRYIMRDMTSPEGAFYSATDADSPTPEGHQQEGWFFTWTEGDIDRLLDAEDARLIKHAFGADQGVNFAGRVILHRTKDIARLCETFKLSPEAALARIDESLEVLYQARRARPAPLRDEKIVTAWNGLMISAFARAGAVLDQSEYIAHARTAADFIFTNLYSDGRLFRSYKGGKRHVNGYLEDYAATIAALLDLYEGTFELPWLQRALQLNARLLADFEDQLGGGFFRSGSDHEDLIVSEKPAYDGAEPSGNSLALLNLLRLYAYTGDAELLQRAERAFAAFAGVLESNPVSLSEMLLAVDFYLDQPKEIIIVTGAGNHNAARPFLREFRETFVPNRAIVCVEEGEDLRQTADIIPLVADRAVISGGITAYVCERGVCQLPTSALSEFAEQIATTRPLASHSPAPSHHPI